MCFFFIDKTSYMLLKIKRECALGVEWLQGCLQ
jgi:hypothetical protein